MAELDNRKPVSLEEFMVSPSLRLRIGKAADRESHHHGCGV